MQNSNSTMCGFFAHLNFSTNFNDDASDFVCFNNDVLKRYLTQILSH